MPDIAVVGLSMSSGHDGNCEPVKATTGQARWTVDSQLVQVIGDEYEEHGSMCPIHGPHTPKITTGSGRVSLNGLPVARVGDTIGGGGCSDEHKIVTGNSRVNVE